MVQQKENRVLAQRIRMAGKVTTAIRKKHFSGLQFGQIRNWLEEQGLDRHMVIQLVSTELLILTPKGALLQRRPSDKNQFGLWGGVVEDSESVEEGLVREAWEELELKINAGDCEAAGIDMHYHCYANGDQAEFEAHRFVLKLDYVPEIALDEESSGATLVMPILSHQREFVNQEMDKFYL